MIMEYNFNPQHIREIQQQLSRKKKIVIATHINPDGDAIGSSLALAGVLKKKSHDVTVISPNDVPEFLKWMNDADSIIQFNTQKERATQIISEAEIIFCLDFNNPKRIDEVASPVIENATATKILIDHHLEPSDFCKYIFSFPVACATAELIYYFLKELNLLGLIDSQIAECLYCGIMTDSGNFKFKSVSPELHQVTAFLLSKGAVNYKIYELVYDSYKPETLALHGFVLSGRMKVFKQHNTVLLWLSATEQEKFNATKDDIDEIVNYGLKIQGIKLSAFFYEQDGKVKTSFRSKGNTSVKEIATKYFNGGGHINAAGGTSNLNLEETLNYFENLLPSILP